MNPFDLVNGLFELFGAIFATLNIHRIIKDKEVKGVSWLSVSFFVTWGYWNLFYYPHLQQYLSFFGGLALAITNTVWLGLLLKYRRN